RAAEVADRAADGVIDGRSAANVVHAIDMFLELREVRARLHTLELYVDSDLRQLARDGLGSFLVQLVASNNVPERQGDTIWVAGLGKQAFGKLGVVLEWLEVIALVALETLVNEPGEAAVSAI